MSQTATDGPFCHHWWFPLWSGFGRLVFRHDDESTVNGNEGLYANVASTDLSNTRSITDDDVSLVAESGDELKRDIISLL